MTETEARRYFNREARYYARGLPPDRRNLYAIQVKYGPLVVAPDTEVLWDRFWEQVSTPQQNGGDS